MDIVNYVKTIKDKNFDALPISELDICILTEMTYLVLEDRMPHDFSEDKALSFNYLADLYEKEGAENLDNGVIGFKRRLALLDQIKTSKRYGDLKFTFLKHKFDKNKELQFTAFVLTDFHRYNFVLYEGTDDTIIGWKEDFNMSYMDEIPAQKMASDFLVQASNEITNCTSIKDKTYFVSGHSKGGSLALYAVVDNFNPYSEKIKALYCFDSPGIKNDLISEEIFTWLENNSYSFYPKDSIIGLLFDNNLKKHIVKSVGFSLMQHSTFLWEVDRKKHKFKRCSQLSIDSKRFEKASNEWIGIQSKHELKKSVEGIYDIAFKKEETLTSFFNNFSENAKKLYDNLKKFRFASIFNNLKNLLLSFVKIWYKNLLEDTDERMNPSGLVLRLLIYPIKFSKNKKLVSLLFGSLFLFFSFFISRHPKLNILIFTLAAIIFMALVGLTIIFNREYLESKFKLFSAIYSTFLAFYLFFSIFISYNNLWYVVQRAFIWWLIFISSFYFFNGMRIFKVLPNIGKYTMISSTIFIILGIALYFFPFIADFLIKSIPVLYFGLEGFIMIFRNVLF